MCLACVHAHVVGVCRACVYEHLRMCVCAYAWSSLSARTCACICGCARAHAYVYEYLLVCACTQSLPSLHYSTTCPAHVPGSWAVLHIPYRHCPPCTAPPLHPGGCSSPRSAFRSPSLTSKTCLSKSLTRLASAPVTTHTLLP